MDDLYDECAVLILNPTGGACGQNSEYIFGWKLQ